MAVVRCAIAYNASLIIPIRLIVIVCRGGAVVVPWWCRGGAVVVYFITGKKKPLSRGVF